MGKSSTNNLTSAASGHGANGTDAAAGLRGGENTKLPSFAPDVMAKVNITPIATRQRGPHGEHSVSLLHALLLAPSHFTKLKMPATKA